MKPKDDMTYKLKKSELETDLETLRSKLINMTKNEYALREGREDIEGTISLIDELLPDIRWYERRAEAQQESYDKNQEGK